MSKESAQLADGGQYKIKLVVPGNVQRCVSELTYRSTKTTEIASLYE